jgi:hypothetical protein
MLPGYSRALFGIERIISSFTTTEAYSGPNFAALLKRGWMQLALSPSFEKRHK